MDVILIGFMGSGKTTVSQLLGKLQNKPVLDLDQEIVNQAQMSIPEIFAQKGERYFRDLEHQVLKRTITQNGILATGGGAPMRMDNQKLIINSGAQVVFLQMTTASIVQRITAQAGERPIADHLDVDGLRALQQKRQPVYLHCANLVVQTDNRSPQEIAEQIIKEQK